MKNITVEIKIKKEVEIKFIHLEAHIRYWDDATVNGTADLEGSLIPCREGELWCPKIRAGDGRIENWEDGKRAKVHYKVCDQCSFSLICPDGYTHFSQENDGVPGFLCPQENGYGDYIIMDIDERGYISGWKPDLQRFLDEL